LTSHLDRTVLSEKMIEDDLSWVEESATKSIYKLGVGVERCEKKDEKSAPKFVPSSSYHKEEKAIKSTKVHYPSNPKPSFNPKREVKRQTLSREIKLLFICFLAVLVTWMSFASIARELRGDALSMLETHTVMSSLIFRLALTLVLHLILLLVLCLSSMMDLTITHMVLVHERTALCLYALITTHILIVVIVSHVNSVFLLEGLALTLR
jgi:magnesium-transporting ATPase (P-type)